MSGFIQLLVHTKNKVRDTILLIMAIFSSLFLLYVRHHLGKEPWIHVLILTHHSPMRKVLLVPFSTDEESEVQVVQVMSPKSHSWSTVVQTFKLRVYFWKLLPYKGVPAPSTPMVQQIQPIE